MQCNKCGNQNNEGAKFCKQCGQNMASQEPEKKEGNKKIIIILIAAALLILIVGCYFLIKTSMTGSSDKADNKYEETLDRGNKYIESLDYENAESEYLEAINIEPKNEEAYVELAELYVTWEKPEEAKKIIAEGIANVPTEKQQKLPEKEEETAEYQGYTWVTEPIIEADDIYYVRSVLNGMSNYNVSELQMESAYAVIREGESLGLIDLDGELIAPLEYREICDANGRYLLFRTEAKYEEEFETDWDLYVLVGDEVVPTMYGGDVPDCYYYYENELHSYCEVLSEIELDEPEEPIPVQESDQLSIAYGQLSGLYGIYSQGQLTVDFIYEECGSYAQGLLAAKKDGKWGYVDSAGTEVIPFEYDASWKQYEDTYTGEEQDYCYAASGGFVVLCKDGVWELRNTQGKVVLPAGYFEEMRPVYEDKCWVKKDGKWAVIQIGDTEEQEVEEQINKSDDVDWQADYTDIINSIEDYHEIEDKTCIELKDIDFDGIPELHITTQIGANELMAGTTVYYYADGELTHTESDYGMIESPTPQLYKNTLTGEYSWLIGYNEYIFDYDWIINYGVHVKKISLNNDTIVMDELIEVQGTEETGDAPTHFYALGKEFDDINEFVDFSEQSFTLESITKPYYEELIAYPNPDLRPTEDSISDFINNYSDKMNEEN